MEDHKFREQDKERKILQNKKFVKEHNARNIPDTSGYVRTTGSRRQYEGSVDSRGRITWIEK